MRRHRPRHYSYSSSAADGGRELPVFVSSLIIGICLGAFAVYFWSARPLAQQVVVLQNQISSQTTQVAGCAAGRNARLGERDELDSRLSTCQSELNRLRRQAGGAAAPTTQAAPATAATTPTAPDAATKPLVIPRGWPALPKAPPASKRSAASTAPIAAAPVEAASSPAAEPLPQSPVPPAVWPRNFPPKPESKPTPPVPRTTTQAAPAQLPAQLPTAEPTEAAGITSAPAAPAPSSSLSAGVNVTLSVGSEQTIDSGHQIRLVAVSRRSNGQYCVVAGNGLDSQRIASGNSVRTSWNGQRVSITVAVQDGKTCRVGVRPL